MKTFLTALLSILCLCTTAQTFTTYTTANGLISNNVRDLAIDSNGDLWFGTQLGVSVFDGTMWISHNAATDTGFINNNIETIATASNGDIWIGTSFGVSRYKNGKWEKFTTTNGLGNNQVVYIEEASNGDIWFATIDGASRFDGANWKSFGTIDGLPFGGVTHIAEAANGDIWLGTGLGGVEVYDGTNFTEIRQSDGLLSDQIRSVIFDDQQNSWIGMANGISVLNMAGSVLQHHTRPFILPAPDTLNPVTDLAIDTFKNVWAAVYVDYLVTEGGICMYNGTYWIDYDMSDGLAGPNVRRLAVDGNNDLWVATSTGVSRLSNLPTNVARLKNKNALSVYPNPAKSAIRISYSGNENQPLEVLDLLGNVVVRGNANRTISVQQLPSGVYFSRLGNMLSKFVKID